MAKKIRHTANYFKGLPDADPMGAKPTDTSGPAPGSKAVRMLLPEWASVPVDTSDDGTTHFPSLPEGQQWDHLADKIEDDAKDETADDSNVERRGWLKHLVAESKSNTAESPAAIIEDDSIRMRRKSTRTLTDDWTDPINRLRKVGLDLAKEVDGAKDPAFQRTRTEGMAASDYPLPGTSFAVFGVRGSFGRQQVATAKVESDRLFMDKADTKHAGLPDLRSAPLNAYRARTMKPGERYKVTTERSILAESGLKYTPTPLPGVTSSMFHDLGPSGAVDFTVAVEGETTIEVVRGFGSKVAVQVSARDERVLPGKDRSWKATVGAFLDGSLVEYVAQTFTKLASKNVENEANNIEDKKRIMDAKVLPLTEKLNEHAAAKFEKRTKESQKKVTLYEIVFDLSNSQARKTFDKLVGTHRGKEVDFGALAKLPADSGVQVVANNVKTASRRGIERTFGAFGFESHKGHVVETSETQFGAEGDGKRVLEEKHAVVRRSKAPGSAVESTTIGRVKTVQDEKTEEAKTGVGFGWRYKLANAHTNVDDLAELLSFAAVASNDTTSQARLHQLYDAAGELPRKKILGMPIGRRGLPDTNAEFAVELNVDAVKQLLAHFDDEGGEQKLWDHLAKAYAQHANLAEPPNWPIPGLMKDGAFAAVRAAFSTFSDADSAFLVARSAMNVLRKAAAATDPVEVSTTIGKAFDALRTDLCLAGGLIQASRPEGGEGVEVEFKLTGADGLDQPVVSEAPADALPNN